MGSLSSELQFRRSTRTNPAPPIGLGFPDGHEAQKTFPRRARASLAHEKTPFPRVPREGLAPLHFNRELLENCAPEVALRLVEPIAGEAYSWVWCSKPGTSKAGQGRMSASRIVGLRGVGLDREPRGLGAGLLLIWVTVEPCGWSRDSLQGP